MLAGWLHGRQFCYTILFHVLMIKLIQNIWSILARTDVHYIIRMHKYSNYTALPIVSIKLKSLLCSLAVLFFIISHV